jgi:hypothetical protein
MRDLLRSAFADLPTSGHQQLTTIPGIGEATAAVVTAKIIDIDRFETADQLVGYFGIFPQESSSGVDKDGKPLPAGTMCMSPKGNDLVRHYLWNAALAGIRFHPILRALYARLKAKGKRGDVAMGHCMRKLLHLVFAVWKTNRPFDEHHFPWESRDRQESAIPVVSNAADLPAPLPANQPAAANKKAVGHKREQVAAEKVVTTASSSLKSGVPAVHGPAASTQLPTASSAAPLRPHIDFAFLRSQITLEQVLRHLGLFESLQGRAPQLRGCCPFHEGDGRRHTLSVHLGKNAFHCFHADCHAQGNALDFWAAYRRLPIYEAALDLAATFRLPRNREEAAVQEPVKSRRPTSATSAVITTDGP